MIKIAVVDDERTILNKIGEEVREYFTERNEIKLFDSSREFFNDPEKYCYDVVFLDIDMPEINGFKIADNLKFIKPSVTIIFVSSMEHLVFESFRCNPFRFVRKSNLSNDIQSAVSEYEAKLKEDRKTYFLRTNDIEENIPLLDIMYFESNGHDIYVRTTKNRFRLKRDKNDEQSIRNIHEKFGEMGFIRVHKSFLVNYKYIYSFRRNQVILKDNTAIDMNPHNAAEIKEIFNRYLILEG